MHPSSHTLTVSQLNRHVKCFLEQEIGLIHVEGEVSNLSKPASGHYYFTLKDNSAQLRSVYFKNRHVPQSAHQLADGQKIIASGRLSLYEARGDYQLIVEEVSEAGLGALYQQFVALKNKLMLEGLFNLDRKKPLPTMPQTIGIITSSKGAALQDILSTLARRFPIARVIIYPSEVQGNTAPAQLIQALQYANRQQRCDVLILARGGGSLEDLWAFNHEGLAREISKSTIPIVSGVGHETDITIADFVADYRAETPTAAAIAVTPDALELATKINELMVSLYRILNQKIHGLTLKVCYLSDKIRAPSQTILTFWQTVDYLEKQLLTCMMHQMHHRKQMLHLITAHVHMNHPKAHIQNMRNLVQHLQQQSTQLIQQQWMQAKTRFNTSCSLLQGVSPLATLSRGYAIATHQGKVVFQSTSLHSGDQLNIRLAEGSVLCEVIKTHDS